MEFIELLKQVPQRPGVYLMFDSLGNVIYVGKAKNLKNRVTQYFQNQKDRAPKVAEMIHNIFSFNYIVTDTELDAFLEECRLIKRIKPRYNKQMKNEGRYGYIKIPKEEFPKVTMVNTKEDDSALYFGPFTSPHRVEKTVEYLQDFYPIRKCSSPGLVTRINGCLYRQLNTCLGVCTGQVSPETYREYIAKIERLLSGSDMTPVQELQDKLAIAIENLQFEKAAKYRDYYLGLRHVIAKQCLVRSSSKNRNILAVELMDRMFVKLFFIRGNRILDRVKLDYEIVSNQEYLTQIIRKTFAADKNRSHSLTQQDIDEAQIIYSYLKKHKSKLISFWIPAGRLNRQADLDATVLKIINGISLQKASVG